MYSIMPVFSANSVIYSRNTNSGSSCFGSINEVECIDVTAGSPIVPNTRFFQVFKLCVLLNCSIYFCRLSVIYAGNHIRGRNGRPASI